MEVENVIKRTEKIMILETLSTYMTLLFFLSERKVFICFIRRKKNYSQGLMVSLSYVLILIIYFPNRIFKYTTILNY